METRTYTETEINESIRDYATQHEVELDAVLVDRHTGEYAQGPDVVGYRLSLDVDGVSRGCDETFGDWS